MRWQGKIGKSAEIVGSAPSVAHTHVSGQPLGRHRSGTIEKSPQAPNPTLDWTQAVTVLARSGHSRSESKAAANALLEERQRISRELHDRALQLLSSVKLRADVCRNELLADRASLERELLAIENEIDTAIVEIRNILAETRESAEIAAGSLERRLRAELEIFRARTGFNLDLSCTVAAHDLPYQIERELYFTLREGVLNAVRHARATRLSLSLSADAANCLAVLADDGVGFEPASAEGGNHYGLSGMRERIKRIGGELDIESAPGAGTRISIRIPLSEAAGAPENR